MKWMYLKIKRLMDIILSLTGLILLSPLFLLLIVLIKLDSKGPVLFKQKRVGLRKDSAPNYVEIENDGSK